MVVFLVAEREQRAKQLPRHRRSDGRGEWDAPPSNAGRCRSWRGDPDVLVRLQRGEKAFAASRSVRFAEKAQCIPIDIIFGRCRGRPDRPLVVERVNASEVGEEECSQV